MTSSLLQGIILVAAFTFSQGYPDGAPSSACATMVPNHAGLAAQAGPPPFNILVEELPDKTIGVTIASTGNRPFKGFLINAINSQGEITGTFESHGQDGKSLNCQKPQDSATHSFSTARFEQHLIWKPSNPGNQVMFRATIVEGYSHFYTNVNSQVVVA